MVVKKRVKLENVLSLKEGDKWLKTISVKRWAMFEREFKKKMKFADQTEVVCHNQTGHVRRYCPQMQHTQCQKMGHFHEEDVGG